jgi:O-succinylbenzoate synthase
MTGVSCQGAQALEVERVTLDEVAMPLKAPFETSLGVETERRFFLVGVHGGGTTGFAETVAMTEPLYSEETHRTVHHMLVDLMVPLLFSAPIADPDEVSRRLAPLRGNRMAKAALDMAVWDWFARRAGMPLYKLLGGTRTDIPVGVSIGIQASAQDLVARAREFWGEGYRRLKIKIRPGWDVAPLAAVREALPEAPIMADANSAYTLRDIAALRELDRLDLMMVEQPLGQDDLIDHAELQRQIRTPVCLDESIRTADDARKAIAIGACRIINVKLGRVGGFSAAQAIHDVAAAHGVPVWCGGMLESGVGRAANLAITSLDNFTLPGDTSASDRYFDEDLIDPPFRLTDHGTLRLPAGAGIGVTPDPARLAKFLTHHEELRAP